MAEEGNESRRRPFVGWVWFIGKRGLQFCNSDFILKWWKTIWDKLTTTPICLILTLKHKGESHWMERTLSFPISWILGRNCFVPRTRDIAIGERENYYTKTEAYFLYCWTFISHAGDTKVTNKRETTNNNVKKVEIGMNDIVVMAETDHVKTKSCLVAVVWVWATANSRISGTLIICLKIGSKANSSMAIQTIAKVWWMEGNRDTKITEAKIAALRETGAVNLVKWVESSFMQSHCYQAPVGKSGEVWIVLRE